MNLESQKPKGHADKVPYAYLSDPVLCSVAEVLSFFQDNKNAIGHTQCFEVLSDVSASIHQFIAGKDMDEQTGQPLVAMSLCKTLLVLENYATEYDIFGENKQDFSSAYDLENLSVLLPEKIPGMTGALSVKAAFPKTLEMILAVQAHGANKYQAPLLEWQHLPDRKPLSVSLCSVDRHLTAPFSQSEFYDPEFGTPHWASAAMQFYFALHFIQTGTAVDDRKKLHGRPLII